ncbi:hypothetical protein [Rhodohalobacter sp. SW132]|uniref:hypothetical protein n=1 Tax=Rhodohalobacter sp. SW132 TaxID=2293433 RepID=UPI0013141F91|nr:hypothetical protein [Rhodohalobacter sp. SW132]
MIYRFENAPLPRLSEPCYVNRIADPETTSNQRRRSLSVHSKLDRGIHMINRF